LPLAADVTTDGADSTLNSEQGAKSAEALRGKARRSRNQNKIGHGFHGFSRIKKIVSKVFFFIRESREIRGQTCFS
jgi:hypothetical protein